MVCDPGGYSSRLRGFLFLGGRHALLRGRVRLGRCDGIRSLSIFVERRIVSLLSEKGKQFGTAYIIAVNRYFLEARKKNLARVSRQS